MRDDLQAVSCALRGGHQVLSPEQAERKQGRPGVDCVFSSSSQLWLGCQTGSQEGGATMDQSFELSRETSGVAHTWPRVCARGMLSGCRMRAQRWQSARAGPRRTGARAWRCEASSASRRLCRPSTKRQSSSKVASFAALRTPLPI